MIHRFKTIMPVEFCRGYGVIVILIPFFLFFACGEKPIEFFVLEDLTLIRKYVKYTGEEYTRKTEFIVIANVLKEKSAIKSVVQQYNNDTITKEGFEKYGLIFRYFYKETRFTPRDYVESNKGYFNKDRIERHGRDLIVRVILEKGEPAEYRFFNED